ncbi:hypothetical protein chiPu_0022000, partial [Chiloscyllium punctatum]|nr:hypothetical protein [Chiloscyllium punctatum]
WPKLKTRLLPSPLTTQIALTVKPDPPESVKIKSVLKAAHKLSVSWSYPQTWQTGFYALKFELAYSMQNTDMFQNKVSLLETSFVITDALPDVNYTVRVRAKEEFDHGAWSNWSEPVYGMPWADPERNKIPEDNTEGLPSGLSECEDCDWEETTPQESQSEQWGSFPWYGLLLLTVSLSLVIGLFAVIVIRYRKKWKGQSAEKGSGGHPPEYLPVRLLTVSDGDGASKAPECIAETALQCSSSPESRSITNASDDQPHFDLINMGYFYIPQ